MDFLTKNYSVLVVVVAVAAIVLPRLGPMLSKARGLLASLIERCPELKPKTGDIVSLVLVGAVLAWPYLPKGGPTMAVIPAPSVELQQAVQPVAEALRGNDQANAMAAFYGALADVVRRDGAAGKVIATKARFRSVCETSAKLRFQGTFQKVPGLSDKVYGKDGAFAKLLGLEAGDLDYARTAAALDALAWACQEAAK